MSEQSVLRRAEWELGGQRRTTVYADQDPLAELARIVAGGQPSLRNQGTVAAQGANVQALPEQMAQKPSADDFLGIDEAAFERALGGLSTPSSGQTVATQQARILPEFTIPDAPEVSAPQADEYARYFAESEPNYDPNAAIEPVPEAALPPEPRKGFLGMGAGMTTVAAVLGLVVVGAAGAIGFTAFTGGARSTGEPMLVRADNRPTRVAPDAPSEAEANAQNRLIFERVGSTSSGNERVVSREEQPNASVRPPGQATPNNVRVILPGGPVANDGSEPRRVATTTIRVRSDGSIEGDSAQAPRTAPSVPAPAPAPAAESQVPPNPSAGPLPLGLPAPSSLSANGQPQVPASRPIQVAPIREPQPTPTPPRREAAPAPAQTAPVAAPAARPQVAAVRPQPQAEAGDGPVQLRPVAAPPPSQRVQSGGGFIVQVASQRSEAEARTAFAGLQRRYPELFNGRSPNIRAVELGDRGTFHRVRVGPMASREEAQSFCTRLRAAGGDCVVAIN
jgi:cell division septation protein DedD